MNKYAIRQERQYGPRHYTRSLGESMLARMSHSDAARVLGLTRQRVQQIEREALEKVRKRMLLLERFGDRAWEMFNTKQEVGMPVPAPQQAPGEPPAQPEGQDSGQGVPGAQIEHGRVPGRTDSTDRS